MLSIFPTMFLALLAHAVLRVLVGLTLLYLGFRHIGSERERIRAILNVRWPHLAGFFVWYIGIVEIVVGFLFTIGFVTQIAALITAVMAIKILVFGRRLEDAFPQPLFYVLLLAASISLFITGAGAFAVDLPF